MSVIFFPTSVGLFLILLTGGTFAIFLGRVTSNEGFNNRRN